MDSLIILNRLHVENANAIAGITWGFPAVTNFLGFTHAITRALQPLHPIEPDGCGIICHHVQPLTYKTKKGHRFSQKRLPLTKAGKTAPIIEEGYLHMTVSLIIPCKGTWRNEEEKNSIEQTLKDTLATLRLAGGTITQLPEVILQLPPEESEENNKFEKCLLKDFLPGFALVNRSELLAESYKENDELTEPFDQWLDFFTLKYSSTLVDEKTSKGDWSLLDKLHNGWLIPLTLGYRAISKLYEPGEVLNTRDPNVPFCFVENTYGIGEWVSPHRVARLSNSLEQIIWRYKANNEDGLYLCSNTYQSNN